MASGISVAWAFPGPANRTYERLQTDIQKAIDRLIKHDERIQKETERTDKPASGLSFDVNAGGTGIMEDDPNIGERLNTIYNLQKEKIAILQDLQDARNEMLRYVRQKYATTLTGNTRTADALLDTIQKLENDIVALKGKIPLTAQEYSAGLEQMEKLTQQWIKVKQSYYVVASINHNALEKILSEIDHEFKVIEKDFLRNNRLATTAYRELRDMIRAHNKGISIEEIRARVFEKLKERYFGEGVSSAFNERVIKAEAQRQADVAELKAFEKSGELTHISVKRFPLPDSVKASGISDEKIDRFVEKALALNRPSMRILPESTSLPPHSSKPPPPSPKKPPPSPGEGPPPTIPFRPRPR